MVEPAETLSWVRCVVDCIFCSIGSRQIPANIVVETENCVAFRDLAPTAPTHVLVVPKRHIDNAQTVTSDDASVLAEMLVVAQEVAAIDGLSSSGYRLVLNVGEDSGNTVAHLHLHVIGGKAMGWPPFAN